jgi:excisionase family DNA binding protein
MAPLNTLSLNDPPGHDWLGLGEAARFLGVHSGTLRRWADHGEIAVLLTPGGHQRFVRADLQRFAET